MQERGRRGREGDASMEAEALKMDKGSIPTVLGRREGFTRSQWDPTL